jgi:hypothetical protein
MTYCHHLECVGHLQPEDGGYRLPTLAIQLLDYTFPQPRQGQSDCDVFTILILKRTII